MNQRLNNSLHFSQDDEDEGDSDASGDENGHNDDVDMETDENQRPQADSTADDDEFNLANYDNEGDN